MLLPIDALRLTRKNMKERQWRLEGYFHTIHEKPPLAPALLLNTGQVWAHNTTFDKITSCSYFYFPNEVKLFKWSITFLNPPEDGRNAAPCHSGLQDGLPYQQRPWAISRPLETIQWVRSQIRKYWPRDSQKVSERWGLWGHYKWLQDESKEARVIQVLEALAGVRLSSLPVTPKPRNPWPTPIWSPLRHSGIPHSAHWVIGCGK